MPLAFALDREKEMTQKAKEKSKETRKGERA